MNSYSNEQVEKFNKETLSLTERECDSCSRKLPIKQFELLLSGRLYKYRYQCKFCRWINLKYGINYKTYTRLIKEQNNSCAICKIDFTTLSNKHIHVDHMIINNRIQVRGILCQQCNIGLGSFEDSIELFQRATEYLRKWSNEG